MGRYHGQLRYCILLLSACVLARAADFGPAERAIGAGDYPEAQRLLNAIRCEPEDRLCQVRVPSMQGAAHLFAGEYEAAEQAFRRALPLARTMGAHRRVIDLLNNLGTVHYYRGEYDLALGRYEEAERALAAAPALDDIAAARQMTTVNLATLYQRIGQYRQAMELYRGLEAQGPALPVAERAQYLSNLAVLTRRLGDPWKARDLLERARQQLDPRRHSDAWLGIVKNLGIVEALDFGNLEAAQRAFVLAGREALRSGNAREALQAELYLAEAKFRAGQGGQARRLWARSLAASRELGSKEEEWRSEYGLSRADAGAGRREQARRSVEQALGLIERLRGRMGASTLKSEFLADKSEVFEHAVSLAGSAREAFPYFVRARALLARESRGLAGPPPPMEAIQARLESGETMLMHLAGKRRLYQLALRRDGANLREIPVGEAELGTAVQGLLQHPAVLRGPLAKALLEADRGAVRRYWIVPDGPLASLPFELLDDGRGLLVERAEVAYLPSAAMLRVVQDDKALGWPWQKRLVTYSAPPARLSRPMPGDERWGPLPETVLEAAEAAAMLPGRRVAFSGAGDVRFALMRELETAAVAHLATHGAGDPEDPARSRLVVGDGYLFATQLAPRQFRSMSLAVLSGCETGRGVVARGEGVQSLAGAFLAAGAETTVASLWRVNDRSARQLMREFYRRLGEGASVAAALRDAKRMFLHSGTELADPSHWAAFVAQGAAERPLPPVAGWGSLLAIAGAVLVVASAVWAISKSRAARR